MERTLIIYDDNATIYDTRRDDFIVPVGLQHLIVIVPEGKRITGVDVSGEEHVVIFEDIPKSEVEILREKLAQQEEALIELAEIIAGGA